MQNRVIQFLSLALLTGIFFACGNEPDKKLRPQLIVKEWRIDSSHLRQEYDGYIEVIWDEFKKAGGHETAQVSDDELKKMKAYITSNVLLNYKQQAQTLRFVFGKDGTYSCVLPGMKETGKYSFNATFDSLRMKVTGKKETYTIAIQSLTESELKIEGKMPIMTAVGAQKPVFRMAYKYIPAQRSRQNQ